MRMRPSFAIFPIFLSVLLSGCTTNIKNEFHGQLRNLKRDGQVATLCAEITGYRSGPSRIGGRFVGFLLPANEFSFFLFHPALAPGETLVTNIPSHQLQAWLIRGPDSNLPDFAASADPEQLRDHGGQQLTGRIAIRWASNSDFYIGVDLAAPDPGSTSVRGHFVGYLQTEADPSLLWQGPAMLLFGAGGWPNPQPLATTPANTLKDR
jgi:hypothetical protein